MDTLLFQNEPNIVGTRKYNRKYPPDTLDKIAELWAREWSTLDIGNLLGINKNTLCRMVHQARQAGDERFPMRQAPRRKKPGSETMNAQPQPQVPPPDPRTQTPYPGDAPTLWELGPKDCRFALTEGGSAKHRFCGQPVAENSPYCVKHTKTCWAYRAILR